MQILLLLISSICFLLGSFGLIDLWQNLPAQFTIIVALKISAYGGLFILGTYGVLFNVNKWATIQTCWALQNKFPVQPWQWRYDWLNGFSRVNFSAQLYTILFSLLWTALLIPIIIATIDELPGMFFWVFGVIFPLVSVLMLINILINGFTYLRFGRNKLLVKHLPYKQGQSAKAELKGSLLKMQDSLQINAKVMFKYLSKTRDSEGTHYAYKTVELANTPWCIEKSFNSTPEQLTLSGEIAPGYPDHGAKLVIPELNEKAGTVLYKLFITSSKTKKINYDYDLPVYSTVEMCKKQNKTGKIINNASLTSQTALLLGAVFLGMFFNQHYKLYPPHHTAQTWLNKTLYITPDMDSERLPEQLTSQQINAITGMNGASRFMLIARYEDILQTRTAYENGGDLYQLDDFGRSVIHHAVACHPNQSAGRTTAILDYLLTLDSGMLSKQDNSGRTPLYWAIDSACLEGVQALLAHGARVTPKLVAAAERERIRLHSRDNFVKEAVINSEIIEQIMHEQLYDNGQEKIDTLNN